MMKVIFCLILLLLPSVVWCQPKSALFRIWDAAGKEGYIDVGGNIVQKPQTDAVGSFSEGLAPVLVGDKWGYVDEKGAIVIAPRWKASAQGWLPAVGPFSEGLAAVVEQVRWDVVDDSNYYTYKCGYIDKRGAYVVEPKFRQSCGSFSGGLARIEVDLQGDEYEKGKGWIGFIDRQGKWAIAPQFFEAGSFSDGAALVQSEAMPADLYVKIPGSDSVRKNDERRSLYLIDKTGRPIKDRTDCRWRYSFRDGLAATYDENFQPRFIDEQCKEVFRLPAGAELGDVRYFTGGRLPVKKTIGGQTLFGYLDRTGKLAIDFRFSRAESFSDGLAGVSYRENDKEHRGYIDERGALVLKDTRAAAPFIDGLAFQNLYTWTISERPNARNIYGYMNKQGKYVWLAPRAEIYLDKNWIKENYAGPKPND